jgi:hypothetical protein
MPTRDNLDEFTTAYIECALWSETDNADDSGGEPLDKNYNIDDVADEAIEKMAADCAKFQADNAELLARARYNSREWSDEAMAGHDFWLTRNRHGAGFWDGDLSSEIGEALTEAARKFRECDLIVGDDGKIYVW